VVLDPGDSNRYVMIYATQVRVDGVQKAAIGAAWQYANALTSPWNDWGRLQVTDVYNVGLFDKAESPHAFTHFNARGDTSYYLVATGRDSLVPAHDRLLRNRWSSWDASADTGSEHWDLVSSLYEELGFADLDEVVFGGWEATEYCRMYGHEYLAAINATIGSDSTYAIWIVMLQWLDGTGGAPDQMTLLNPVTSVEDEPPGGGRVEVNGLRLSGRNPGGAPVEFEVTLAGDQSARLDVYDMQGRRVRTLSCDLTTAGRHRLSWDGRDARGGRAACGVYFARLGWTGGHSVVRLVLVR
jgi:hypothetical protein